LCHEEDNLEKEEEYLFESLSYIDEKNCDELLFNVNLMLSNLYVESSKYEEAVGHLVKCVRILGLEDMVSSSVNIM
jgi:hypothetical protein